MGPRPLAVVSRECSKGTIRGLRISTDPLVKMSSTHEQNNLITKAHMHRLQLSRNLWDSPGFLDFVEGLLNLLFVPEPTSHYKKSAEMLSKSVNLALLTEIKLAFSSKIAIFQ